jgi:hypothetical protein
MKIQQWLFLFIGMLLIMSACVEPVPIEDLGYEAPPAPTEVNQNNLFTVEFFSQLNDARLFEDKNFQPVVSHIAENTKTLAFFFDRSDAVIGQTSPVVQIAWETRTKSFFVQNNLSNNSLQGTGIIVRSLVNAFEGIGITDSLYLSGCVMSAPLSKPITLNLMTCKLIEKYQFPLLVKALGDMLLANKILIGSVKNNLAVELQSHLKKNMKDFRISFFSSTSTDKTYQLFFLTPVNFVHRDVKVTTVGKTPMFECKIEYLN